MISTLAKAVRTLRAALRRVPAYRADSTSALRHPHDRHGPVGPFTPAVQEPDPDFAALAALVMGGAISPIDALVIALAETDQHPDHTDHRRCL